MTKFLHSILNDDVCLHIFKYTDTFRQYFTEKVLPQIQEKVHERMVRRMWEIMYTTGRSITEGLRNLEKYLLSDDFDFERLKYNPDFYYIDSVYFQHAVMKRLWEKPEIKRLSHPLYAIRDPIIPPYNLPPPPPRFRRNHLTCHT